MKKKVAAVLSIPITILLVLSLVSVIEKRVKYNTAFDKGKPIVLKMAVFSDSEKDYFKKVNLVQQYKKVRPEVDLEIESFKDNVDFENSMKIRKAAKELPDLIPLKVSMLEDYKDILLPLNDTKAYKDNKYAFIHNVGGKIMGIPMIAYYEFVYYRKSIFKEYGLDIPVTWGEFIQNVKTIKNSGKYIPIAMGGKDGWPDYPFNEFIPFTYTGDNILFNHMGMETDPFSKDDSFYKSYLMVKELYDLKPFGAEPLETGWDKAESLFISGETAMLAAGQWFATEYISSGGNEDDLGAFFLPVRKNAIDPFYIVSVDDEFLSIPSDSKNKNEALDFLEWFFDSENYSSYIKALQLLPTTKEVSVKLPMLDNLLNNDVYKTLVVGNEDEYAKKLREIAGFDPKELGQEMLTGKQLDDLMHNLSERWRAGR